MAASIECFAMLQYLYPNGETASHLLGYIGRISSEDKRRLEDSDQASNYAGASHMGKTGVELAYERILHGTAGAEEIEVSAGGRTVRSLSRRPASAGANLILSIDMELQRRIEEWFGERRGALVAIEPATGEVIAFVSKPYDAQGLCRVLSDLGVETPGPPQP